MIVVRVELWPFGNQARAIPLGTATITNDGSGGLHVGNYNAEFSKRGAKASTWKSSRVEGFPRKRLGAWDLLYRALRSAVGGRNP
jgi:hypothetical protein